MSRTGPAACLAIAVALLGCTGPASTPLATTVRVWSGEAADFLTGDVSPDGRLFSDIDWDTGDLEILDLETGESRGLTGEGYDAGGYAWTSAFSSDGSRLAVSWYLDDTDRHELRVISLDGTGSRVLVPADASRMYVDPVDWSPDDSQVLVAFRRADLAWQLGLVSTLDGSVRILKTLGWMAPGGEQTYPRAWFSPDGAYIAYDYRPDLERHPRSIYTLAVDGGAETEVLAEPAAHRLLGWLPDGSGLLFHGRRGDRAGVWRLPVRAGRATGAPVLVHPDVPSLYPLGMTRQGYTYGAVDESQSVHTATVDLASGRVTEAPRPVDGPSAPTSLAVDWSPDGSTLAYVRHAPQPDALETLVLRRGDSVRTIPLAPTLHTSSATLRWVNEETIVLFAMERGRNSILRLDPRDGSTTRVPDEVTDGVGLLKWFAAGPGGRTLYFVRPRAPGASGRQIVARDAATGGELVLAEARTDHRTFALSADGARLAYVARGTGGRTELWVTATAGTGAPRMIHRAGPDQRLASPVTWTPDGGHILFMVEQEGEERALWSVRSDGTSPVRIPGTSWCCTGHALRFHPDGHRVAAVAGTDRGSIWRLESYRP